jgi:arginyl-tRNA synthetase
MANYLVDAASAFSDFYRDCPVLQEYNPARRLARIGLCRLSRDVLGAGLGSLGIESPDTM